MDPLLGAAIIGAGAKLVGGLFNSGSQSSANKANVAMTRETNALNYRIFREQNQFNEEMLNQQLEYNTPLNQRQRLEEAGINPYLALGNISTGNQQSSLTSASPSPMQSPQVQPNFAMGNAIGQAVSDFANTSLALSQARKNDAESTYTLAQAGWLDRQNEIQYRRNQLEYDKSQFDFKFSKDTLGNRLALSDMSVNQANEMYTQLQLQTEALRIQNDLSKLDLGFKSKYGEKRIVSELANIIADTAKKYEDVAMSRYQRTSYMPGMLSVAQTNAAASMMNAQSQRMLTSSECKKLSAEVSMIAEEKAGIKLDNEQKSKIQDYIVENYKLDYNRHALEREAQSGEHGIGYYGNMILDYLGNKISNGLRFNFGH